MKVWERKSLVSEHHYKPETLSLPVHVNNSSGSGTSDREANFFHSLFFWLFYIFENGKNLINWEKKLLKKKSQLIV